MPVFKNTFENACALLVGVSANGVPELNLPHLVHDLASLEQALIRPDHCAYPAENVRTISGSAATRSGILSGLDWLKRQLTPGTTGLLYLAGHIWVDRSGSSPRHYLLPGDVALPMLHLSALPLDEIITYLENAETGAHSPFKLFTVVDGCYPSSGWLSFPAGFEQAPWQPLLSSGAGLTAVEGAASQPSQFSLPPRAILVSSRLDQPSRLNRAGTSSLFIEALLGAFAGEGRASPEARQVMASQVLVHVEKQVAATARAEWNARQQPASKLGADFPVGLLLGGRGLSAGEELPGPGDLQSIPQTTASMLEPFKPQYSFQTTDLPDESSARDRAASPDRDALRTWESAMDESVAEGSRELPGREPDTRYPAEQEATRELPRRDAGETSLLEQGAVPAEPVDQADSSPARFLNALIENHDPGHPLPPDQEFVLAVSVELAALRGAAADRLQDERLHQPGEPFARLSVHLSSHDFRIYTQSPQELRLPPGKASRNRARFDLEPLHTGPGIVQVLVYRQNNFVQGLTITLNIGDGEKAIAAFESLGRPVEGALALNPRDANLYIRPAVDGFDLTLVGAIAAEARLQLTNIHLNQMIQEARKALLEVVYLARYPGTPPRLVPLPQNGALPLGADLPFQSKLEIPEDAYHEALRRLATAGFRLYRSLFFGPYASTGAEEMGNALRQLSETNRLHLQIVSRNFLLPWGLLYLAEDLSQITPERFLGFRHIIEHIPLQKRMSALDPAIPTQPQFVAGLLMNTDIDSQTGFPVVAGQLEYWQKQADLGRARFSVRRTATELLEALQTPENNDQLLYFYGHAHTASLEEPGGPESAALYLSGDSAVTLGDLNLYTPSNRPLAGAPLVFINACESASLSPLFYDGFMPYFTNRGARGMIGAECEIPVLFANEWARRFFDRFFAGQPLGQIFLELRLEFLTEYRNPLGLLYALYCDADTRLNVL